MLVSDFIGQPYLNPHAAWHADGSVACQYNYLANITARHHSLQTKGFNYARYACDVHTKE